MHDHGGGRPIDIVYEDPINWLNCTSCDEWATPGVRRLYDSWVHRRFVHSVPSVAVHGPHRRPRRFIYPIGLFHTPGQWAGPPVDMRIDLGQGQGPFMHVSPDIMRDARDGRVLFVLDQAQEGNADRDLWRWFYRHCGDHGVPPEHVVYLTSDHFAEARHADFCELHGQARRIHVIGSLFNMYTLSDVMSHTMARPEWHKPVEKPYLYNCLNRMGHQHRRWLWIELMRSGMLPKGLVSMDMFDEVDPLPGVGGYDPSLLREARGLLPMVVDNGDFSRNMFNNVNTDIYANTWFSVVTETYVDDGQMLIGEKVFKPMMCFSPFMVLSTAGTMARLRELGFRTFPMLWDESYDEMPVGKRVMAITAQVVKCDGIADKAAWIDEACDALQHNHRMAWTMWSDGDDRRRILAIWQKFLVNFTS